MKIVLSTLNARYSHASLGLRYLRANMGELRAQTQLAEYVIGLRPTDIVERLLAREPRIIGFGVYIWNVVELTQVVALLKCVAPNVIIVLGGPEVSHEVEQQEIVRLADHVITGWGDLSFAALCRRLLAGQAAEKVISGEQPPLAHLALPYDEYSDTDIAQRNLYVEASRGCPFKCEFCLSALDKTAWPFPLDAFLDALERLYARGARRFKFVDRTFNLKAATGAAILDFLLAKLAAAPDDPVFAHFELVPDHLPNALRERIRAFPPGTLQFEIGIQTFNPEVQALISRKQDNAAAEANLRWLIAQTQAHLHADLILGLPGEDMASIAAGFDRLYATGVHEIQVGLLKRLRGAPIARHTETHGLIFDPAPPYTVLATDRLDFATMQRLGRFARYWDLVGNSGRFAARLPTLLGDTPFARFLAFSDWLYALIDATQRVAPDRLASLIDDWLGDAKCRTEVGAGGTALEAALPPRQRRHLKAAARN
jgi:hypothetical protein